MKRDRCSLQFSFFSLSIKTFFSFLSIALVFITLFLFILFDTCKYYVYSHCAYYILNVYLNAAYDSVTFTLKVNAINLLFFSIETFQSVVCQGILNVWCTSGTYRDNTHGNSQSIVARQSCRAVLFWQLFINISTGNLFPICNHNARDWSCDYENLCRLKWSWVFTGVLRWLQPL